MTTTAPLGRPRARRPGVHDRRSAACAPASGASGRIAAERERLPRSGIELGQKREQIATQLATIAAGEPCGARSIERLGHRIRGRNRL